MSLILGKYKNRRKLGLQNYSDVSRQILLVEDLQGKQYALILISLKSLQKEPYLMDYLEGEIKCMQSLNSPYIMGLIQTDQDDKYKYMLCQYCDGGDLLNLQAKQPGQVFTLERATEILAHVIMGLQLLHKQEYLHRDIKLQNVLIKNQNGKEVFKLAGLYFSKKSSDIEGTVLGTENYMSPEIYRGDNYGFQVDIWAFGVLFFFMLNKEFPFKINPHYQIERKEAELIKLGKNFSFRKSVENTKKKIMENCTNETEDLFNKIFNTNAQDRISFHEMRKHALFKKYFPVMKYYDEKFIGLKPINYKPINKIEPFYEVIFQQIEQQQSLQKRQQGRKLKEQQDRRLKEQQNRKLKEQQDRKLKEQQNRKLKEQQDRKLKEQQYRKLKEQQDRKLGMIRVGKFTSNFGPNDCIGSGGFGTVYGGYQIKKENNAVAIKIINLENEKTTEEKVQAQIQLMVNNQSDRVVKILAYQKIQFGQYNQQHYAIVMEKMDGSLKRLLKQNKKFKEIEALQIIWEIIKCFQDLYEAGVIHRDLKPDNILYRKIDDQLQFKITDFGFARDLHANPFTHSSTAVLSFGYSSPQLATGQKLTFKTDVYSLGCILFQLLLGSHKTPFAMGCVNNSTYETNHAKINLVLRQSGVSNSLIDFVQKCLVQDEEPRLSWEQIFNHQIFGKLINKKGSQQNKKKM